MRADGEGGGVIWRRDYFRWLRWQTLVERLSTRWGKRLVWSVVLCGMLVVLLKSLWSIHGRQAYFGKFGRPRVVGASSMARREPIRTILSGPAGGVVAALTMGKAAGFDRLVTFDMGGTSTDVCLLDGAPALTMEAEVAGIVVKTPMLDIHTVGAGGGSLVGLDAGGALTVGPESVGADPGPACYGRGDALTVTDANLFLGRLTPDRFLGGAMSSRNPPAGLPFCSR